MEIGAAFAQGQVSCAMPETFMVIVLICEMGMPGSMGAVAMIETIPLKPEQWARPFASMLTPAGVG